MPDKHPDSISLEEALEKSKFPSNQSGLQILPVSHDEFQARWALSKEILNLGLQAASQVEGKPLLVLRAYSLPTAPDSSDFSSIWRDYSIDSTENSAYFTLPTPMPKINAAIGLLNKSGRFSPLIRGEAIELPPSPSPESLQSSSDSVASPSQNRSTASSETAIIETGGHGAADEFKPSTAQAGYHSPPGNARSQNPEGDTPHGRVSEEVFSQWEALWTGNAPIEIRAEFVLTGKVAPGMKLLLGNQLLEPDPEGFVVWKRELNSFEQVWPLLQEALSSPSVEAGPSLEFFKEVNPSDKLLELQSALKIAGKVSDPEYYSKLPKGLTFDANGVFKLSRMLPDGAVILPSLSLIATS